MVRGRSRVDPDHAFVDHLIEYKQPTDDMKAVLETFRDDFKDIAHRLVDTAPPSADRTVALRKIHEACMATIFSIVANNSGVS